jgi:hypothetical protein
MGRCTRAYDDLFDPYDFYYSNKKKLFNTKAKRDMALYALKMFYKLRNKLNKGGMKNKIYPSHLARINAIYDLEAAGENFSYKAYLAFIKERVGIVSLY